MALQQPDRLKSQLLQTGLQQKDPALFQVINSLIDIIRITNTEVTVVASGGGGGSGITQLTGDVAAGPGTGSQIATIQPDAVTTPKIIDDAVTYAKMQETALAGVLLGRSELSAGNPEEIPLGDNLEIRSGVLEIVVDPTAPETTGISHRVLSGTHEDSLPASPVLDDLIYAGPGTTPQGFYVNAAIVGKVEEDFEGYRAAYMLGFNGADLEPAGNIGWGAPPPLSFVAPEVPQQWLVWQLISAYLLGKATEDFEGIRASYGAHFQGITAHPAGNVGAYAAYPLDIIAPPDPNYTTVEPAWQRLPLGSEGQVLGVLNGGLTYLSNIVLPSGYGTFNSVTVGTGTFTDITALASISTPVINGELFATWVDVTFNAGDFTANGGTSPAWTLTSPDQVLFRYCYIGAETMMVQVYLAATTVSSSAGSVVELRILIPDGRSAVGSIAQLCGAQENGAAVFDIYCGTDPGVDATKIFIRTYPIASGRAFDQTANASFFGFTIIMKVS